MGLEAEPEALFFELSSLPVPKSNRYLRRKDGKVFKPPRVKNWEVRALWELSNQASSKLEKALECDIAVEIELTLPDRRRRDIDNMLKSLWDIMERAGIIKGDHQICQVYTRKVVQKNLQKTSIWVRKLN
ncbi:MAG: RusA family crossover junction endodeoxyribonuclease [Aquificaceae bacterium]|nr:RusA family crossover junction endodeoxyribonuclease [Aquificaceae bacterium]